MLAAGSFETTGGPWLFGPGVKAGGVTPRNQSRIRAKRCPVMKGLI